MSWLLLSVASAALLGFYDFFKKLALRENAVTPVLAGSVWAGAAVWLPFLAWSRISPATLPADFLRVDPLGWGGHLMILAKAVLVALSWVCGYHGIKSLPLSIATPIRASGPLWTILFAVLLFREAPSAKQWLGVTVILSSFFAFTFAGRREGIHFHRHRGVWLMAGATLLGSASALYDKFLLQRAEISPSTVQAWFSVDLAGLLVLPLLGWRKFPGRTPFRWHWAIPVIGLTLLAADFLYFIAVSRPDALISLISPVRRTSVVVSFLLGIFVFRERRSPLKALCVLGIAGGVLLLA